MTEKMPALFKVHPPKSKLETLSQLVDDWIFRFGKRGVQRERRDLVVEYTAEAKAWPEAVRRAVRSKNKAGKHHNHQSRVPLATLEAFGAAIVKAPRLKATLSFDELYDGLTTVAPHGIGPVTLYDVATRLAGFKVIPVMSLYLHAGVRIGWTKLHGCRSPALNRIPREQLPKELLRLPTDEVEDFLCAYRSFFKPWLAEDNHG